MSKKPKYPDVEVELVGQDGNTFSLVGQTQRALRHAGVPKEECKAFFDEALSGDYDNVLETIMKWVTTY